MQHRRPLRKLLLLLMLCTGLGIITTVAVAWGLAYFGFGELWAARDAGFVGANEVAITAHEERTMEQHALKDDAFAGMLDAGLRLPPVSQWRTYVAEKRLEYGRIRWVQCDDSQFGSAIVLVILETTQAGWPAEALAASTWWERPAGTIRGRWSIVWEASDSGDGLETHRTLPLRPILPGFIINTLFYAAVWFALLFGFTRLKRTIRKKRGKCPMCTYDLRGDLESGCSECGWGRIAN